MENKGSQKLAVIKTGGKQYLVKEGDRIKVEKLKAAAGEKVAFPEVLLLADGENLQIGKPFLSNIKVEGKVILTAKGKKVRGIKHKPKKRYKVKFGHRQFFTEVEIVKIPA